MRRFALDPLPRSACPGHNRGYDGGMRCRAGAFPIHHVDLRRCSWDRSERKADPCNVGQPGWRVSASPGRVSWSQGVAGATCPTRAPTVRRRPTADLLPAVERPGGADGTGLEVIRLPMPTKLPPQRLHPLRLKLARHRRLPRSPSQLRGIRLRPRCWRWRPAHPVAAPVLPRRIQHLLPRIRRERPVI